MLLVAPTRKVMQVSAQPLKSSTIMLSFSRIPLAPVAVCYNIGVNGSIDASSLWGLPLILAYIAGLTWLAGYWLDKEELLLYQEIL
jgi:hypothetical protein